ncbi:MAG: hypothetical protein IKL16_04495 [Clostridia bacterium]|nr:hypothetical protein [Clostridia bacterium]
MHMFDDKDMKIFGSPKIENEADVLIRIVEIMKKQRANGNMDRAKALGETIARKSYALEGFESELLGRIDEYKDNEDISDQIRMLVNFTVEAEIHVLLEKYSVSTMTVNAFYDELIKLDEDLYDNITNAFTYYYLVLRKGGDVASGMGKQFAKLCSDKENEKLQILGKDIFNAICENLKLEIEKAEFVNE